MTKVEALELNLEQNMQFEDKIHYWGTLHYRNIELLAYYLYEREGCPVGRSFEHWVEAERQLSQTLF